MTIIDLVGQQQRSSLAERLTSGSPYALMFGGQGGQHRDRLAQLRGTYGAETDADGLWRRGLARIEPVLGELAPWWPADPRSTDWHPRVGANGSGSDAPDAPDPRWNDPAASVADIAYTQLLEVRALRANRFDVAVTPPTAVLGHSQGTIAAFAVTGAVDEVDALALAHLIGVAVSRAARHQGLVRSPAGSPMLGVAGITRARLNELIEAHGDPTAPVEERIVVGVTNGPRRHVLVGRPDRLARFIAAVDRALGEGSARPGPARPTWDEIAVEVGFHHPALADAVTTAEEWARRCDLGDAAAALARGIATEPVDWPAALSGALATAPEWIVDIGPGVVAGRLTRPLLRGTGVGLASPVPAGGVSELITPGAAPEVERPFRDHRPGLLQLDDGSIVVETRLTRATGHSPIVLAGMTPTTVDAGIVAAAANAGAWAELAGGGQVTAGILQERIAELRELLDDGVAVHFNTLHLDPYLWSLHLGAQGVLFDELRRGAPIRGVTVSAGIPALDEAVALIERLTDLGVETVTFKPGTIDGISQVIDIAEAVAPRTVVAHIEGGRAGGHHSWEDLDDLLLATYADLRRHDHLVVCVGGGIGTPATAATYLDGTWALAHGRPPMPVDGILIGTAAMACAEATTSPQVKRLLAESTGTDAWIAAGEHLNGVASGRSQLGADIHELDNAASRAGRLLDEVAGDAERVADRRDEIIEALAATAKPYFGNVAGMTYAAVLRRFAELCAIGRGGRYEDGRWIDRSWRERFVDLAQRTEARLDPADSGPVSTLFTDDRQSDDPTAAIAALMAAHPDAEHTLLHPADVPFFVEVCRRPGKPVPFVPVIDEEVRRWWRSDSLWQAHDDRYDADAVVVIPGPAAIAGIEVVDEPIGDLIARFEAEVVASLRESLDQGADVPTRRSSRRRAHDENRSPVSVILSEPAVTWAGDRRHNPALAIAPAADWLVEAGTGIAPGGRARLVTRSADRVDLEIDVAAAGASITTTLRLVLPAGPGRGVVVDRSAVDDWSTELLAVAAGGDATDCDRDHAALFGATTPLPDSLVALAWPSVFAALGDGAGGFIDLVHLDHTLDLRRFPDGAVSVAVAVGPVTDTTAGRLVTAEIDLADDEGPVAHLVERFLVRSAVGTEPFDTTLTSPATDGMVPTERRTLSTRRLTVPPSGAAMARFTGDHNPLHTSTEVARVAGFAAPIAHGMWVSAAMQHAARTGTGLAAGVALESWQARFLAPLRHGDTVEVDVVRIGQRDGGLVVEVTARCDGTTVAQATARLGAPATAYAFPGQGIQRVGMGLDALGRSAAARSVWDRADRHTRDRLGFSIVHVVRDNPVEITTTDQTFRHPDGVLHLTQFTQVAMATLASAQVAELREVGGFVPDAVCCGHSVGEYNALAAVTGILELEAVLELVYHRGLAMHRLVPRDAQGASRYRMAAARPSEAGLDEDGLVALVADVGERLGIDADDPDAPFLQVVNYNLRGRQYAIAGTTSALALLESELEERRAARNGKGVFVYVPGIDVPFHSAVLRDGVPDFRDRLDAILPDRIDLAQLVGRYVPNLVPRPFTLDRDFVAEIGATVPSTLIAGVLTDWAHWSARPEQLTRVLLLELLAWQFASPVRWIETQDLVFSPQHRGGLGVERFVEIGLGSQPTISSLARQTLQMAAEPLGTTVLNIDVDRASLFGTDVDDAELDDESDTRADDAAAPGTEPASPPAAAAPPAASTTAAPATVADLVWAPADGLRLMLSWWTKLRPEQLGDSDSIEALCDGASSRRNQLLMDLGSEFGLGAIDGAAEAPLTRLAEEVATRARTYRSPGPVLRTTIDEQLRRIAGPAKSRPSAIADRVRDHWGLGSGWAVHAGAAVASSTRSGASTRGGDLAWLAPTTPASPADLDALTDAAVLAVAARVGVTVAPLTAEAGGTLDAAAAAALLDSIVGGDGVLTDVARVLDHHLRPTVDVDPVDPAVAAEAAALTAAVDRELGSSWVAHTAPAFRSEATLVIDDRWAGQREDLLELATATAGDPARRDELQARLVALDPDARRQAGWHRDHTDDADLRSRLENVLAAAEPPAPFAGEVALVTGASPGSIAAAVVARLLAGGAKVVATSSRLDGERVAHFRELYHRSARPGAELWLAPANLASAADVDGLVDWVLRPQTTSAGGANRPLRPGLTPTLLFPFAAPSVGGQLGDGTARAEQEMRVLLWSVEQLIARLADARHTTGQGGRLHVVLPGSPNRGMFGGDGAYGEAKAALDALARRSVAEPWGEVTGIVHAVIGWVRGTGLMAANDAMVDAVESAGITTWSTDDIADALLALCNPATRDAAAGGPVDADLSGGLLGADLDLRALAAARAGDDDTDRAPDLDAPTIAALPAPPRPVVDPAPAAWPSTTADPADTVVIVGLGEVGPLGSARTRFEVEVEGRLSAAGVAELAWLCGLIRWEPQPRPGFYDTETNELVPEAELGDRYHDRLMEHSGIRILEDDGAMTGGSVPLLASVYLERDLTFTVDDEHEAAAFVTADPERTSAVATADGSFAVTRRAGTEIRVPRRTELPRHVGAQIPTGFDPTVYGIPADMVSAIDRVAVWNLVATVDAFVGAGIEPAELLSWVHPAEVANTQGTGIGGISAIRSMYVDSLLGEDRPNDVLQEALPNVVAAHVMQSYIGGYGSMIHPVAACATAAVSVEEGFDKIRSGRAAIVVAGGFDDYGPEGLVGFAAMNATAPTADLVAAGIEPSRMSRPNDRRRAGFVEGQGGGTVVLARGDVAAELGLPVRAVVAWAGSFSDGVNTSIPAPGLGLVAAGRGGPASTLARRLMALGVAADDVAVVSKHDTSTLANDPNESLVHEQLATALGRSDGNPLVVVSQKSVTGHAKGGAAAFQIAGLCQILEGGVVPGNRSLDCVDPGLREHGHLVWPTRPVRPDGVLRAGLITSLGFGHVAAVVALVHPDAFPALLAPDERAAYLDRSDARRVDGARRRLAAQVGGDALYRRPDRHLGDDHDAERTIELAMLLDADARLAPDGVFRPGLAAVAGGAS